MGPPRISLQGVKRGGGFLLAVILAPSVEFKHKLFKGRGLSFIFISLVYGSQ